MSDLIERLQRENEELRKAVDMLYEANQSYEGIEKELAALKASTEQPVSGETSDGYHTFNELYAHRHALFIKLMRSHPEISWRANNHEDGTMFYGGWFIAGMHLPTGDISYHLPVDCWELLDHSGIATSNRGPKWDGHTASDVVTRLNNWWNWNTPPTATALVEDFKRRCVAWLVEAQIRNQLDPIRCDAYVVAAEAIKSLPLIEGAEHDRTN